MITRYQWGVFEVDLNPIIGSGQGGRRPVLVVSNEPFNQAMFVLTVLPLTSTQRRLYPAEVCLPKRTQGYLWTQSSWRTRSVRFRNAVSPGFSDI
jgi:mRNA-degrading endonuclease toxin of MazEF toxin-antitoxin module